MKKGTVKVVAFCSLLSLALTFPMPILAEAPQKLTSGGQPYLQPSLYQGEIAIAEQSLKLVFDPQVSARMETAYTLQNMSQTPQTARVAVPYLSTTAGRGGPVIAIDGQPLEAQARLLRLPEDAATMDFRGQGVKDPRYDFPALIRQASEGTASYVPHSFQPEKAYSYYQLHLTKRPTFSHLQSYLVKFQFDASQTKLLILEEVHDSSKGNWYRLADSETDIFHILVMGKDTLRYDLASGSVVDEKEAAPAVKDQYRKENQTGDMSVGGIDASLKKQETLTGEAFVKKMAEAGKTPTDLFQYETFLRGIDELLLADETVISDNDLRVKIQGNENALCVRFFEIPFSAGRKRTLTVSQPLSSGIYEPKPNVVELSYWFNLVRTDTCFGWKEIGPAKLTVETPSAFQRNVRSWWLKGSPPLNQTSAGVYTLEFDPLEKPQLEVTLYMDIPQWHMAQLPPKTHS